MYIYIDESGTFVHSPDRNSWCVVAAYVIPEHLKKRVDALVHQIRNIGNNGAETKLKNLSEEQYKMFLSELQKIGGLAFAVAVDMGLHDLAEVERHKEEQADKIVEHRDKMLFETARDGLTDLSQKIRAMPVQLYTQLVCQLHLFHKIITVATLYYVQKHPPALGNFRWRLDRKAKDPTVYESVFRQVLPAILQTKSLEEPMIMLKGEDYSQFERFCYSDENRPTYLQTCYGIQSTKDDAIDIGKIVSENFKLVDSASCSGVQIADLLAGGFRRMLRGSFAGAESIARLLGANMAQEMRDSVPVMLISLDKTAKVSAEVRHLLKAVSVAARPMLTI